MRSATVVVAATAMIAAVAVAPGAERADAALPQSAAEAPLDPALVDAIERDLGLTEEEYSAEASAAATAAEAAAIASSAGVDAEPRIDGDQAIIAVDGAADAVTAGDAVAAADLPGSSELAVVVDTAEPSVDLANVEFRSAADARGGDPVIFGGGTLRCSIGASGTDAAGARVLLTAGHCSAGRTDDVYRHQAVTGPGYALSGPQASIGPGVTGSFRAGSGIDAGLIRVTQAGVTPLAEIEAYGFAQSAPRASSVVVRDTIDPVVGAPVCKSGATSGWTCGRITSLVENVQVQDEDGPYAVDGVIIDACMLLGDSGGPALVGSALLGINSATSFGNGATDTSTPSRECATTPTDQRLSLLFAMRSSLAGLSTVATTFGNGWEPTVVVDTPAVTAPASAAAFDATRSLTVRGTLTAPTPRTRVEVRWGATGRASGAVAVDGSWAVTVPSAALAAPAVALEVVARWGQRSASKPTILLGSPATGWRTVAVDRIQGETRYDTAVGITKSAISTSGIGPVFLVVGTNYPDALAASPVAAQLGGAVLLTAQGSLPPVVAAEIRRLDPTEVIVVGGPLAISETVRTQVANLGYPVRRIAGDSRYDTAALLTKLGFPAGASSAFIATGTNFPDGLAAGAAGGTLGSPVLLVPGTTTAVPPSTSKALDALNAQTVYALGALPVMSASIVNQLDAIAPTTRIGGDTRYDTATLIARLAHPTGATADRVYLATGANFPDALAAGSVAGAGDDPLLLVQPTCIPIGVLTEIAARAPSRITVLGGPIALGSAVDRLGTCS